MSLSIRQIKSEFYRLRLGVFAVFAFSMGAVFAFLAASQTDITTAASTAGFKAGNIMTDYVMSNSNSMSVADIQRFLTSKNPCNDRDYAKFQRVSRQYPNVKYHWENDHFVCISEERFGDGTTIGSGQTAAEIIYQAAQDYGINPQVLIVLLQKEQGLITDTYPQSNQYRSATGYGCPDTAACEEKYYGFKNQVRQAAYLFRYTLDHGYSVYPEGRIVNVRWSPNGACGSSPVYIENRATAALYRYTPYQPNAAALASGYGTGDACSAYGNRNFYLYFTDWFGSTQKDIPIAKYQAITDGEYVIASGLSYNTVLATNGNSNGSNVLMRKRDANQTNQRWRVQYHAEDYSYTFTNVVSGKVLDLQSQATANGGNVHLYENNDTCAQRWNVIANDNGSKTLLSSCSRTYAIDVTSGSTADGANVQVYTSNNTPAQQWFLIPDAVIADGIYEIVAGTNDKLRLDIAGGLQSLGNETNVQIYEDNNTAAQRWKLKYNSQDGTYTILNPYGKLSLDVRCGEVANKTNVQMFSQNNTPAQKWYILPQNDGYNIVSVKSGRVLDIASGGSSNSTNVQIYESNQTKAQKWSFINTGNEQPIEDGIYEIIAGTNNQKALDVSGGVANARNGTNVQIYERNQTDAQKWKVAYNKEDDSYDIVNVTSNLSLDVASGSISSGANIQVYTRNGTAAQKWFINKNDDGSFTIKSVKSGLPLDIFGGGGYNGANVWQYTENGTPAQKWQITKVSN